jgi:hypothetical protein
MIVDKKARRQLAELLRHFVAGLMTNDEFAVRQVLTEGAWFLYDDLHEHRLTGKYRVNARDRSHVARWILFLESDLPYEWPVVPVGIHLALVPFHLVTLASPVVSFRLTLDEAARLTCGPSAGVRSTNRHSTSHHT